MELNQYNRYNENDNSLIRFFVIEFIIPDYQIKIQNFLIDAYNTNNIQYIFQKGINTVVA